MTLQVLDRELSICKLLDLNDIALSSPPLFLAITQDEISLVCGSGYEPRHCIIKSSGWRAMKATKGMDSTPAGVIADVSGILAEAGIPVLAMSTFDTDYILIKDERLHEAMMAMAKSGYDFVL